MRDLKATEKSAVTEEGKEERERIAKTVCTTTTRYHRVRCSDRDLVLSFRLWK